jgi:hypothetical protein
MKVIPKALFLVAAFFTAGGVWMVVTNRPGGWAVLCFFGACLVMATFDLWRGRASAANAIPEVDLNGELVLRQDRLKSVVFWVGCLGFVAAGFWLKVEHPIAGWASILFFGIGVLILPLTFLPGASYLRLTRDELTIVSLFRRTTIRWADIERFGVLAFGIPGTQKDLVGMRYAPSYRGSKLGARIASAMTGFDGAIPASYGLPPEDLSTLLNDWRGRASGTR